MTLRRYPSPRRCWVVPIHWSLDPAKTPTWAEEARQKYPSERAWAMEMEIDFGSWIGARAYSSFSAVNRAKGLEVQGDLPICLCCDFNVQPQIWAVCQIHRGLPRAIEQIKIGTDATSEAMVREFRNRWPAHRAEVKVYGDASGKARGQTGKTDYQLIELAFRGYSAPVSFMVPDTNPSIRDRINTVNRCLKGRDGSPLLLVDEEKCPDLIADFQEVAWRADGKDLLKVWDYDDPYHERTHISDAIGYFLCREFSIGVELSASARPKKVRPLRYGRLIGDVAD